MDLENFVFINHLTNGLSDLLLFVFLFFNSVIISFAFHLIISAICILTLQIDHMMEIYRDLTAMARFPTDIYPKAIQGILTFTIPVIIIFTVPAKALLGFLSLNMVIISFLVGILALFVSLWFWRFALRRYSSASS